MKNPLLSSVIFTLVPLVADAAPVFDTHIHTNTPMELSSISPVSGSYKTASVCFLGVGDCDPNIRFSKGDNYGIDTAKQCLNEGFVRLNCNSVQEEDDICPYNSAYGKTCKCRSNLITCPAGQVGVGLSCNRKFTSCKCSPSLISCPANQTGIGASCGGKYEGCSCSPQYAYSTANCPPPRVLGGTSCGGKYTRCSCPPGVSTGVYGCAEYYPAPCPGICKKAYTDNCHNRTAVSTPYGCMEYWSDCRSKCKRGYSDNCRNRTAVPTPYGCKQKWSDCQSKCRLAYPDNCHNRFNIMMPENSSCSAHYSDCPKACNAWECNSGYTKVADRFSMFGYKCKIISSDPCQETTAVSIPGNAYCSSYYAECPSKCSAWACNSGYIKSGNACVEEKCPSGWIEKADIDNCMDSQYRPRKWGNGNGYSCWEGANCSVHVRIVNGKECFEYAPIARLASTWHEENTYCGDCNQFGTYCDLCAEDEFYDPAIGNKIIEKCSVYDR